LVRSSEEEYLGDIEGVEISKFSGPTNHMKETNKFLTIGLLGLATALALFAALFFAPVPFQNCYLIVDDQNQTIQKEDQDCKVITVLEFKGRTERY